MFFIFVPGRFFISVEMLMMMLMLMQVRQQGLLSLATPPRDNTTC